MLDWLRSQSHLLGWLALASVVMLAVSAIVLPWVIAKLPADHFVVSKEERRRRVRHPVWRMLRGALGLLFIIAGVLMLVLPGQGVLSILVGLMLFEGPGKQRFEQWLVRKPGVLRSLNWLRRKTRAEEFVGPDLERIDS